MFFQPFFTFIWIQWQETFLLFSPLSDKKNIAIFSGVFHLIGFELNINGNCFDDVK